MAKKTNIILAWLFGTALLQAQFRTRDRMDNMEDFDQRKLSWGFYLVANNFDYKLVLDPHYGMSTDGKQNLISSRSSASFGAGLIGRLRLNETFDLRLEPALQFVQRDLTFNTQSNDAYANGYDLTKSYPVYVGDFFTPKKLTEADKKRSVKSTYIDIPLLLEVHGDRWYNSRPYVAAGINYLVNLQSNEKSEDDNQQGIFRTTTHNFGWSVEAGIQLYFQRFKLTPAIRGTFFTNNEMVRDNAATPPYWAAGISSAQTRAWMLVLKFE